MTYSNALLIEDDHCRAGIYLQLFSLKSPDTEVTHVDNLADAIEEAQKISFELYICDGDFPLIPKSRRRRKVARGAFEQFYQRLIEVYPNPNIIVLSLIPSNVNRARELGIRAYLKGRTEDIIKEITGTL